MFNESLILLSYMLCYLGNHQIYDIEPKILAAREDILKKVEIFFYLFMFTRYWVTHAQGAAGFVQ